MNERIIPRENVARRLSISTQVLLRYESMGLVRCVQVGDVQGYEPAQVRRIWSITSYQRDLGVNLAGVEVILQLQDRMSLLHHHLKELAANLAELADQQAGPSAPADDSDQTS